MTKKICVLGLGYVGLTLTLKFCQKNFEVIGYDTNKKIINDLKKFKSHIYEEGLDSLLKKYIKNKKFKPVSQLPKNIKTFIITVGTPIIKRKNKNVPDLKHIKSVTKSLSKLIKKNTLLIYRSTLPLGSSRNLIYKLLKRHSNNRNKFFLGFAPERTAEGNALKELSELPQIVSGIDQSSLIKTQKLFKKICKDIIKVDTIEEAELIKLTNNAYRDLSFAFSNQIALICSKYKINAKRLIELCNYKYPRSLVPTPSPGVGGPCLTKDPYILNYQIKNKNSIFLGGRSVNNKILNYLVKETFKKVNSKKENLRILLCGLSFKGYPQTKDLRGSAFINFYKNFSKRKNIKLYFYDNLFEQKEIEDFRIKKFEFKNLIKFHAIFFLNNSKDFKKIPIKYINNITYKNTKIFDFWNILSQSRNKLLTNDYYEIGEI